MELPHVEFHELAALMEQEPDEASEVFLDLETGRPVVVSHKVLAAVEEDDHRTLNHLTDTQRREISLAADIASYHPERYVPVPHVAPSERLKIMQAFAEAAADADTRAELRAVLTGRGAFRRFHHWLAQVPAERLRWAGFRRTALEARLAEWLTELGATH